jgi:hypothetical protein
MTLGRAGLVSAQSVGRPTLDFRASRLALPAGFTFSRASGATFVDAGGNLVEVGANVPRYHPGGLLIERIPATNLMPDSEAFGTWSPSPAAAVAVNANVTAAPNGTQTADKLVTNDTLLNAHGLFRLFAGAVSTTYAFSMFLKAAEYQFAQMRLENTGFGGAFGACFDLVSGVVSNVTASTQARMEPLANGWWRCVVVATSDADGGGHVAAISPFPTAAPLGALYTPASTGLGIFAWGAQVETGFMSSYIATGATTVNRAADLPDLNPALLDLNRSSLAMRFRIERGGINVPVPAGPNQCVFGAQDAGANVNALRILTFGGLVETSLISRRASVTTGIATNPNGSGSFQSAAAAWADNSATGAFNGAAPSTAASSPIGPATAVQIGAAGDGFSQGNLTLQYLRIWRGRRLSAAQVQAQSARIT